MRLYYITLNGRAEVINKLVLYKAERVVKARVDHLNINHPGYSYSSVDIEDAVDRVALGWKNEATS